jgi:hypothetical protein
LLELVDRFLGQAVERAGRESSDPVGVAPAEGVEVEFHRLARSVAHGAIFFHSLSRFARCLQEQFRRYEE